ncbi:hypothetical protein BA895_10730 [Humibacillus sp. DSM 29435]|uniref:nucleoside deaminase n=1 Tax=Humibacillus sp. DSM 29435 TaxID=1869167 RepID=UPI0008723B38|nr:nucleoside deaminase [Humibacillus sp. DSM 29435]OFE14427.1 hypothetical protein BA895_10730 [Humibacillus sp. DSM 29435]
MSNDTKIDQALLERTVELANTNVDAGGKPFACLIVKDGAVVVEAANQVSQTGDVTAHAEITALRAAALQGITDLTGYEMYVTAYPCPMCLGALYYATPDRVVFAATREQEGEHYDDGNRYMSLSTFYAEYSKPTDEQNLPLVQGETDDPTEPFRRWSALND